MSKPHPSGLTFEAATTRKDTEKKPKLLYEIVPTVLPYLVCAKADHVDPNQMRGLLSPLYRFRSDLFLRYSIQPDGKSMLGF